MMVRMNIIMNIKQIKTLDQIEDFLISIGSAEISAASKDEAYQWIAHVLKHFRYRSLRRPDKALIQRFLMRVTGYSRQQLTRLIKRFYSTGILQRRQHTTNGFQGIYTATDIALLAGIDALHDTPSGPMIKKLCERAHQVFGDPRYERLAQALALEALTRESPGEDRQSLHCALDFLKAHRWDNTLANCFRVS